MPEVRYSDTWNHRNFQNMASYEGVNVYDDHLLWYYQVSPDWAGSAANEQSFLDFLSTALALLFLLKLPLRYETLF